MVTAASVGSNFQESLIAIFGLCGSTPHVMELLRFRISLMQEHELCLDFKFEHASLTPKCDELKRHILSYRNGSLEAVLQYRLLFCRHYITNLAAEVP